jgi:hypothetical protein
LIDYRQTDQFSLGTIVKAMLWMVLHRPVELAGLIRQIQLFFAHRCKYEPGPLFTLAQGGCG